MGGRPPRKADEVTGTLGLKLEDSLVSALDDKEVGVYGNFDAEELLVESEFDFAGAGEPRIGLERSSDFSDGVLRWAGGGVLWEDELWLLLQRACTGVVEALPFEDSGVFEWALTDALSSGVLVFSLAVRHDS